MAGILIMGRFMSATGQFLLATNGQFSCPPVGSSRCPLTRGELWRAIRLTCQAAVPGSALLLCCYAESPESACELTELATTSGPTVPDHIGCRFHRAPSSTTTNFTGLGTHASSCRSHRSSSHAATSPRSPYKAWPWMDCGLTGPKRLAGCRCLEDLARCKCGWLRVSHCGGRMFVGLGGKQVGHIGTCANFGRQTPVDPRHRSHAGRLGRLAHAEPRRRQRLNLWR